MKDDVHRLWSAAIGQWFAIAVAPIVDHERAENPLPVLYVTDADEQFGVFAQISRVALSREEIQPFLLVGIGYGSETEAGILRMRDFYEPATRALMLDAIIAHGRKLGVSSDLVSSIFSSSGAAEFQSFIEQDLVSFIDTHYRAITDRRALFGFSSGATFVLRMLLGGTQTFTRYGVASPATVFGKVDLISKMIDEHYLRFCGSPSESLSSADLLITVGEKEDETPGMATFEFRQGAERVAGLLRQSVPQTTLEWLPNDTHATSWINAYIFAIRRWMAAPSNFK